MTHATFALRRLSFASRWSVQDVFLLVQFVCYLIGIGFSAGGGNYPGLTANAFLYLKGFMLSVPLSVFFVLLVLNPKTTVSRCLLLIRNNVFLFAYLAACFLSTPLAVDSGYSLNRLLYTLFGMAGIFSLILQYGLYLRQKDAFDTLKRHMNALSIVVLMFPVYVLLTHPIEGIMPGFRHALQETLLVHPNLIASFYAHFLVWQAAVLYFDKESGRKILSAGLNLIFACLIAILFSRSVIFSLIIAGITGFWCVGCWYRQRFLIILSLLGAFITAFVVYLILSGIVPVTAVAQLLTREGSPESFFTMTNRLPLWSQLLSEVGMKEFLVGHGYSVMTENFGIDFQTGIIYSAHNAYLSILLGSGILALACFIVYLLINLIRIRAARHSIPSFMIAALFFSHILFVVNCLVEEEIGINTTITFAYLVFMTNMLYVTRQAANR
jgi:hypothetical protein